jgi:hypothetical protein
MAPLVALSLVRANGADLRQWGKCLAVGAVTTASWYLPTAAMHGGVFPYQRFCNRTIRGYFEQMSVLYGAPASMHATMLGNVVRWTAATFGVAIAVVATAWVAACCARRGHRSSARILRPDSPRS